MKKRFTKKGLVAISLLTALCSVETVAYYNQTKLASEKEAYIRELANNDEVISVSSSSNVNDYKVKAKKSKTKKIKTEDENVGEVEEVIADNGELTDSKAEKSAEEMNNLENNPSSEGDGDGKVMDSLPGEIPTDILDEDDYLLDDVDEDETSEGETLEDETSEGETGEEETGEGETGEGETEEKPDVIETDPDYEVVADYFRVKKDTKAIVGLYVDREDESFTKIEIPAGVKSIAAEAFEGYKYVKEVTYAENAKIKSIGDSAFSNCMALKKVQLPDSVTSIGECAFSNCQALVNITLSANLKTIGRNAFDECFSINKLIIPNKVKNATEIMGTKGRAKKVTFAEGRTYIPAGIFKNAKGIKAVVIPKGVYFVRKQAFMGCSSLTKVSSPTTLKKIYSEAYKGCSQLVKYSIKPSLYYIGPEAFRNCESLESLVLNKTVTFIGKKAFAGATNLTVKVVTNSMQKRYAVKNKIKWTYTDSEMIRRNLSFSSKKKLDDIAMNKPNTYPLKKLKNYVPQGVCVVGKYTLVSAYKSNGGKSIILVYNSKGEYQKFVYVPNSDHVGSICNVKGKIALSLNNISANDYIAIISVNKLNKVKSGKTIKYDYKVKIAGHADYTAFDGTHFWAGHSVDKEKCILNVYKLSTKKVKVSGGKKEKRFVFKKKKAYYAPGNIQGLIVNKKSNGKREVVMSQSYGVIPDSHIYVYNVKLSKKGGLGKTKGVYRLPAMLEGITKKGKYMYLVFESASGKYTKDDIHQTEIRIDKLYKIKYNDLDKLYKDE